MLEMLTFFLFVENFLKSYCSLWKILFWLDDMDQTLLLLIIPVKFFI